MQPVLEQSRFLNLVGGTMRGGLIDDACQCAKLLGAGGYSRVVQGICHLGFSLRVGVYTSASLRKRTISKSSRQVRLVPCVDGSELARGFFTFAGWSVQPCVRPVSAAHRGRWP